MITELYRDKRDNPSLCVTCAGQNYRDKRDTPLGGVTTVTLARLSQFPITPRGTQWVQRGANVVANVVPMTSILGGGMLAGRGLAFSLPKIRGKNDG